MSAPPPIGNRARIGGSLCVCVAVSNDASTLPKYDRITAGRYGKNPWWAAWVFAEVRE